MWGNAGKNTRCQSKNLVKESDGCQPINTSNESEKGHQPSCLSSLNLSNTSTSCPFRLDSMAQDRPANPAPTMMTFMPVEFGGATLAKPKPDLSDPDVPFVVTIGRKC